MFLAITIALKAALLYFGLTLLPAFLSLALLAVMIVAAVAIAAWLRLTAIPDSLT
jgi:hypothetical protein